MDVTSFAPIAGRVGYFDQRSTSDLSTRTVPQNRSLESRRQWPAPTGQSSTADDDVQVLESLQSIPREQMILMTRTLLEKAAVERKDVSSLVHSLLATYVSVLGHLVDAQAGKKDSTPARNPDGFQGKFLCPLPLLAKN